jgi:hypothetical protein
MAEGGLGNVRYDASAYMKVVGERVLGTGSYGHVFECRLDVPGA